MMMQRPKQTVLAPNGKPWNFYVLLADDCVLDLFTSLPIFNSTYVDDFIKCVHSFAEVPVCFSGRVATLTGKHAKWSGVVSNGGGPIYEQNAINHTFLSNFQRAGYDTAFIGKGFNQLGKSGDGGWGTLPFKHPGARYQSMQWKAINYFNWEELGSDGQIRVVHGTADTNLPGTDYALDVEKFRIQEFLDSVPANKPWVIYHSTKGCHRDESGQAVPPARYAAASVVVTNDSSFGMSRDISGIPDWIETEVVDDWDLDTIAAIQQVHRQSLRVGLALDENLDLLLQNLVTRGMDQNTVIVLLTDNTIASGEHRLDGKGTPHRSAQGKLMYVKIPGLPGGVCTAPIQDIDVAPLMYELAGIRPMVGVDGMSILPALQDLEHPLRECVVGASYAKSTPFYNIRGDGWSFYQVQQTNDNSAQEGGWQDEDETINDPIPDGMEKLNVLLPLVYLPPD